MDSTVQLFPGRSRAAVQGIVLNGIGVGIFASPYILQGLIEEYGWRGGMLIAAGLALHVNVAGALLRDPNCRGYMVYENEDNDIAPISQKLDGLKSKVNGITYESSLSAHSLGYDNNTEHDVLGTAAPKHSNEGHDGNFVATDADLDSDLGKKEKAKLNRGNFSKKLSYWLIFISYFLCSYGLLIFFTHFVAYAIHTCDLTESNASTLLSFNGLGSIIGRPFFGVLMSKYNSKPQIVFVGCLITCSILTFLITVSKSWFMLFVCVFLQGFFLMPAYGMVVSEMCLKVVGKYNYSYGMGILMVASASGLLLGPPSAGNNCYI